ncbi:hypothetical protein, partial [Symbiobacterium thermophilum]|uniref:hypothetical protein n=1 Tax=Symbiobacterium thermophilum TaxID=2734 RepID=UPI0023529D20
STQETEYSVSCVKETGSLSIPNPFQRYPIYLTLHKILDGTVCIIIHQKNNEIINLVDKLTYFLFYSLHNVK